MNDLDNTRRHIQRIGKILYTLCRVGTTLLIIAFVVQVVITVALFFAPQATELLGDSLEDSFLYEILTSVADLSNLAPKYQALIGSCVLLFSYAAFYVMLRMFGKIMKYLADAERPFDVTTARQMRRKSFFVLLFIVYNPVLAAVTFVILLLFSYIMEYGGYIQERADETNRIQEEMILSFAEITENKSGQTGQHIKRVSEYSRILAEELGLEPGRVEFVRIASTMHDVGKLLIPSEILEKPGKLTDEEYSTIKTHTTIGGQLLENVEGDEMQLSRTIAMQHHERFDGNGYPRRMHGDDISLEGRIVAVADVYDALTSKRSYKDAWSEADAYREIVNGRGTQFDPQVVDAFIAAHDKIVKAQEQYRDAEAAPAPAGA